MSAPNTFPQRNQATVIIIDTAPAYEFLLSINTFGDFEHCEGYDIGKVWFDTIRAKFPPHLLPFVDQCYENWLFLLGLVYDCPLPRNVSTFLAYVEATEPMELYLRFMGYYTRYMRRITLPNIMLRASEGDKEAQKQSLKNISGEKHFHQKALSYIFSLHAEELKDYLLEILRWWEREVFHTQEAEVVPIIQRDAEAKRALQQTLPPERFIEVATNGFEYVPEPFIRQVVLVPSFVSRPYLSDIDHHDTMILCYAVADESLTEDTDAPPPRLVKLYKALADERRLRILKKLAGGSYSLQEVADDLGLAKSTIHHHFLVLRSAGLVRVRTNDRRYSLRQDKLPDLTELLDMYLKKGT